MISRRNFLVGTAALGFAAVAPRLALADQYLGSYVARMSQRDHFASDGYRLDSAAQVVRQDRANLHRFGRADSEDQGDPWFGSNAARARLERLLNQRGAMDQATRRAILDGQPLIEVDVYQSSVEVRILRN